MEQPAAGTYLLTNSGFSLEEKPFLALQQDGIFANLAPVGKVITLAFDMTTRFCVGWRDIRTGETFACPDRHTLDGKYDQCQPCQNRTGFNPAFYHAASVSAQQEERNAEPHILYLAHFASGIMKVGISYSARQKSRLLEQGARSAVILDTFPTAHIARQYEAKIAKLPGIAETIQLRKKIQSLERPYDHAAAHSELVKTREEIERTIGVSFSKNDVLHFTDTYFPNGEPTLSNAHEMTSDNVISGKCIGMLGSLLFCAYADSTVFLPMKKYTGYQLTLGYTEIPISLPAQQTTLF